MKSVVTILVAVVGLAVSTIEALLWGVHGLGVLFRLTNDLAKAHAQLPGGVLHCPRGHAVLTEGGIYECASCGFRYEGSIWLCPNPECEAPTSSYCTCPDCGLSVKSPYRLGAQ